MPPLPQFNAGEPVSAGKLNDVVKAIATAGNVSMQGGGSINRGPNGINIALDAGTTLKIGKIVDGFSPYKNGGKYYEGSVTLWEEKSPGIVDPDTDHFDDDGQPKEVSGVNIEHVFGWMLRDGYGYVEGDEVVIATISGRWRVIASMQCPVPYSGP